MSEQKRQARIIMFQVTYSLGEDLIGDIEKLLPKTMELIEEDGKVDADAGLVEELTAGMNAYREIALDAIENVLEIPLETISRVEQVVMLLAVVEMHARPSTPKAVIINEWLEISKQFGAQDGYRLVNVVLDKISIAQPLSDGS